MTEPHDHDGPDARLHQQLSELLADAVSDVEPANALDTIRHRTKVTPMSSRRPWLFAAGGAVVATAAVITAIALAGGGLPGTTAEDDPGPAGQTSGGTEPMPPPPTEEATDQPTSSTEPPTPGDMIVTGIYYVGDTPFGPRLYREFHAVPEDTRLLSALEVAASDPLDPDYRTYWPVKSFASAGFDGIGSDGQFSITLADESLRERPSGMSEEEAAIAVEALIYTIQASGGSRAPVQFYLDQNPIDQVYGVPTSEPLVNGPVLDTLARVSLTSPEEGETVPVDSVLKISGVANSFEANVVVELRRDGSNDEVVAQVPFTAAGYMEAKLFPFAGVLDLAGLDAGTYLLFARTDDPSGEGRSYVDSRTIVIE